MPSASRGVAAGGASLRVNAFGTPRPDEGDALADFFRRQPQQRREQQFVGKRGKAARKVVGSAVAFRLADDRDDGCGINGTLVDERLQFRDVIRCRHCDLVQADFHGSFSGKGCAYAVVHQAQKGLPIACGMRVPRPSPASTASARTYGVIWMT